MENRIYHLQVLSALHVGTGQGSGIVDLPIARERATHLPVIPGSGIKGVLREELRPEAESEKPCWRALFGPERIADNEGFAGALAVGDARLLCLPVRSLQGTFAMLTCPMVLRRYLQDWLVRLGKPVGVLPLPVSKEEIVTTAEGAAIADQGKVILEDLDLIPCERPEERQKAADLAKFIAEAAFPKDPDWQSVFCERFSVVTDGVFDFLAETATEIRARIRIEENTRTVKKGGLWYEENLPAESLLWGLVACDRSRHDKLTMDAATLLAELPIQTRLQVGGKATVGRGQCLWAMA
jgi:CRISPR-associated protein Cmr4